jgi:hypothetical protein
MYNYVQSRASQHDLIRLHHLKVLVQGVAELHDLGRRVWVHRERLEQDNVPWLRAGAAARAHNSRGLVWPDDFSRCDTFSA